MRIKEILFTIIVFISFTTGISAKVYKCEIDLSEKKWPVSKELFGTNIEWFNHANGIYDPVSNRIDTDFTDMAREQGVSLVRFPGGTLSDFYHWQDGIGKQAERKISPHHTDPASSKNVFGSPELIKFCELSGASPLITVNAGTGTPEEAAAWVSYMNHRDNAKRINDGITRPVGVKLWEIGNELYLNGNEVEKNITLTPAQYVKKYLAFAEKMKTADPSVSLMALGVAGSYNVPFGPYTNWNRIVISRLADQFDYIAVHNGYFPFLYEDKKNYDPKRVYQALWGAPLSVDQDLSDMESLLETYCKKRVPAIAVTEWGPFFSITKPAWTDHVKTMGAAVYVARMYQVFLSHPRVKVATYFKFTDNTFMGWISHKKIPKIPFYVVKLFANHFGEYVVESRIESPLFDTKKTGFVKPVSNVPVLNVLSSVSESSDTIFISIVSCSWDEPMDVLISLKNVTSELDMQRAQMRVIEADTPLAHNGDDIPDGFPYKADEPSEFKKHTAIKKRTVDCTRPVTIKPSSVVMIEISKKCKQN